MGAGMSGSNLTLDARTLDQARQDIARKDAEGWYPARHGSGDFGIIAPRDGREVARCRLEADRDFLVQAVRGFYAMRQALEELLEQIDCLEGVEHSRDTEPYKAEACWDDALKRAQDALARAKGKV
jgi:hypothetical protein